MTNLACIPQQQSLSTVEHPKKPTRHLRWLFYQRRNQRDQFLSKLFVPTERLSAVTGLPILPVDS